MMIIRYVRCSPQSRKQPLLISLGNPSRTIQCQRTCSHTWSIMIMHEWSGAKMGLSNEQRDRHMRLYSPPSTKKKQHNDTNAAHILNNYNDCIENANPTR
uniref:Uncharacterized protein n=1 Tax=Lotharella globosa TaxID=91324 RepID=A0A7S3Z8I3_9EUKA|mmetsp:Transcript_10561/g.20956  ORF Transcript_10561/g.20956 Transcript_10561/m.20956 type:complete len:100 (-) Transcript_10561:91-390(-)